jgi:hypothetical protein
MEFDAATDEQKLVPAGLSRVRRLQKHGCDCQNCCIGSHKVPSIMEPLVASVVGNFLENPGIVAVRQKRLGTL